MGSPLASSQDVQDIVGAIGDRNTDWLNTLYEKTKPSPSHLMFACASVLGDGGQEHIADLMRKVPAKQRRSKFIDLAIQLATADDTPTTTEAIQEVPVEVPADNVKKRRRRSKAEMDEARLAEAAAKAAAKAATIATQVAQHVEPNVGDLSTAPVLVSQILDAVKEVTKAVYALEERVDLISGALVTLSERKVLNDEYLEKWVVSEIANVGTRAFVNSVKLDAIKDGLSAAELELVMSGKLGTAAISDTLEEAWPKGTVGDETPF